MPRFWPLILNLGPNFRRVCHFTCQGTRCAAKEKVYWISMAGPPLMTSSNVDTQKEKDKAEEQPCPKRRRTSIDDSNNSEEQVEPGHEAAGGAPAEGDGGELVSFCARVVYQDSPNGEAENPLPANFFLNGFWKAQQQRPQCREIKSVD